MEEFKERYELLYEGLANNKIPVKKFKSKFTNLKLAVADIPGPLVQGFFCLATEASDDDGLPHILEHVTFLGSERYPYKGVLDKVATRCLSGGTNAWTDKDHTCYTITTAGLEGFLNLLPIYLDHILYPILSSAAYVTEVHHITGEGKDGGVVYSEMQAVENTGTNKIYLEMLRNIYPLDCGYRFETGGILENIRNSTNNEKVKDYHKKFYRPENLYLIITGKVELDKLFQVLSAFEEKVVSKQTPSNFERPWMKPVAPLTKSLNKVVKFPSDDSDEGLVTVAWRGPNINDQYNMGACLVLMEYLTDTPVALLNQTFIEIEDPFCGDIDYSIIENMETIFHLEFESVSMKQINEIEPKLLSLLNDLGEGIRKIDMERMKMVLQNETAGIMDQLEEDPHYDVASNLIGDFLYGLKKDDLDSRLKNLDILKRLEEESEPFWQNYIKTYISTRHHVTVIGKPSPGLVEQNGKEEEKRIKERHTTLGEGGLLEKNQILVQSVEENNKSMPDDFLLNIKIPDLKSLHYHSIKSYSNCGSYESIGADCSNEDLKHIPCSFQLDDIQTAFVTINLCLDIQTLPPSLFLYLPIYIEVLFESPIIRNNVEVPYETVVQRLSGGTVDHFCSLGLLGSRFQPGEFSSVAVISAKLEMEKFVTGMKLFGEILSGVHFTAKRVATVAKKMLSDIKQQKREADVVVEAVSIASCFKKESPVYASSMLTQQHFLKDLQSVKNATKHLKKLEEINQHWRNPKNMYVSMATDVAKLEEHIGNETLSAAWNNNFFSLLKSESNNQDGELRWNPKRDNHFIKQHSQFTSCIVGIGSTDSSYLVKVCPGIDNFNHPDVPALLVFCHFITTLEGPMWKLIRGKGLAYSFSLTPDFNEGLLGFRIEKSADLFEAYKLGSGLIQDIINGSASISQLELECAKCQCVYELIRAVQNPNMASKQNFSSFMRNISLNYHSSLIETVQNVTSADLMNVAQKHVLPLIDPKTSTIFIACPSKEMLNLLSKFQELCQCKFVVSKNVNSISL